MQQPVIPPKIGVLLTTSKLINYFCSIWRYYCTVTQAEREGKLALPTLASRLFFSEPTPLSTRVCSSYIMYQCHVVALIAALLVTIVFCLGVVSSLSF
jgi:hypothetical protein